MDKALKQRLVGAIVLIALAVIVLPMIFGGRPSAEGGASRSIELPAEPPDLEFETRRFPVGEEGGPGVRPGPPSGDVEVELPDRTVTPLSEPVAGDSMPAEPVEADTATEIADAAEEVAQAAEQTTVEGAGEPPTDQAASQPDNAGMEALVENLMASQDNANSLRYVVQVASFGNSANSIRLAGQLQQAGYAVLQDHVSSDTGQLNRVRVGPYASEAEAQRVAAALREQYEGVNPRIVDMQPDEAGPALASEDPLMRWVVQVGSFSSQDNAQELVARLRASGLSAFDETVRNDAATIHRVRVGPFLDRADALEAEQKIADDLGIDGVVMSSD